MRQGRLRPPRLTGASPRWRDIDITAELETHWRQQETPVPDRHRRLEACRLHIALDLMSYAAYRRRWTDLSRIAEQISLPHPP